MSSSLCKGCNGPKPPHGQSCQTCKQNKALKQLLARPLCIGECGYPKPPSGQECPHCNAIRNACKGCGSQKPPKSQKCMKCERNKCWHCKERFTEDEPRWKDFIHGDDTFYHPECFNIIFPERKN